MTTSLSCQMHGIFSADETRWPPKPDGRYFGMSFGWVSFHTPSLFLVLSQQAFFTVMQRKLLHLRHCECCIMMILNVACWSVFMQRSRTQEKACQFRPRPKTSIIQWQEWWNLHYSRPLASSLQPDLQNWDENVKRKVLEEGVNNWAT